MWAIVRWPQGRDGNFHKVYICFSQAKPCYAICEGMNLVLSIQCIQRVE